MGSSKGSVDADPRRAETSSGIGQLPKRSFSGGSTGSILLAYADGIALRRIAQEQGVTRMTVDKCIKKALSMGVEAGLKDLYHRPKDPVITPEAKAWVVSLACSKPVDLGLAAETWTRSALAAYVRTHAKEAGLPSLSKAAKATVHRILAEQELAPHKVTYSLERKDPEFDRKMREVLMVYREIVVDTRSSGPRHGLYRERGREARRPGSGACLSQSVSRPGRPSLALPGLRICPHGNAFHPGRPGPS